MKNDSVAKLTLETVKEDSQESKQDSRARKKQDYREPVFRKAREKARLKSVKCPRLPFGKPQEEERKSAEAWRDRQDILQSSKEHRDSRAKSEEGHRTPERAEGVWLPDGLQGKV